MICEGHRETVKPNEVVEMKQNKRRTQRFQSFFELSGYREKNFNRRDFLFKCNERVSCKILINRAVHKSPRL